MERHLTACRIAPIGWGGDGVLVFEVFVAASKEDEGLRACVNAAVELINHHEARVKVIARHYHEDAVMPTNGDVQLHIDGSMGGSDKTQITIGLLGSRLGDGSREEILKALNARDPSPALFVFHPTHILGLADVAHAPDQAAKRVADHNAIRAFVSEIESSGAERGQKRRCIAFKESELEHAICNQLQHYIRLWSTADQRQAVVVPTSAVAPPRGAPSRPRYRGLKPYRPEDAPYFFGREDEIKRLVDVLKQPQVQTLHLKGGSGVGKSSLVLAGLLPRIAGGSELRHVIILKPGTNPFLSLARAVDERRPSTMQVGEQGYAGLAERLESNDDTFCALLARELAGSPASERRILYVDQLEELLLVSAETDAAQKRRQAFGTRLCAFLSADPRNTLLTSIRTDRDDLLGSPTWRALGRRIAEGRQEWIYAPEVDEALPAIVRGPAELAHLDVDPLLIKALRSDVQRLINWPPLLGAALEEIALCWEGAPEAERQPVLTLDHYRAVGGLAAVIERRTRTVTESLTEAQRTEVLPQLFPLLVRLDEKGRATKRRFPKSRLRADTPETHVLELLINGRLLVDEGEVEVSHDLLFEVWAELAAWIKRYGEDLDELSEIEHQARRWVRRNSPDVELLAQDRLERAERALHAHPLRAKQTPELEDFVVRSRVFRDQAALVTAIPSGNLEALADLLKRDVVLNDHNIQILENSGQLVFYYALFPARIPREKKGAPTSIAAGFKEAGEMKTADPRLEVFTAENTRGHVSNNLTVQHYAAFAGNMDVLKRLQDIGADLMARTDRRSTPLVIATSEGRLETVQWLVSLSTAQADQLKERGLPTPLLHHAAYCGSEVMARYLLDNGAEIDEQADWGATALVQSLFRAGSGAVSRLLIAAGANLEAPTSDQWRALGIAITNEPVDVGVVQLLLEKGADPNATNDLHSIPPLLSAAERGYVEIVDLLLSRGANVNATNSDGLTALNRAAYQGAEAVVRSLSKAPNVDLEITDRIGYTALASALHHGEWQSALILLEAGANVPTSVSSSLIERIATTAGGSIDPARLHLIERLVQAGIEFPPFKQWARDPEGQPEGLVPKPPAEIEQWFSRRLAESARGPSWTIASLLDGPWTVLDIEKAAKLLARATACEELRDFGWLKAGLEGVRSRPFPPYPLGQLHEVSTRLGNGAIGYLTIMEAAGDLTVMTGESAPLHDLNVRVALDLSNAQDAGDYLRLFCGVVCGDEGNFTVVERPEQLHALDTMTEEQRGAAALLITPLRLETEGLDDRQHRTYDFAATVKYGNALFSARFRVMASGEVEMTDDDPKIADLASMRELFGTGPRRILTVEPAPASPSSN